MRSKAIALVVLAAGCASGGRGSKGPAVAVFEADAKTPPAGRRLPEGCRLLGLSGPIDQMESERVVDDPYGRQRREVAQKGGNALLVLSERTVTRPNPDCPSGDASPDCLRGAQNWYRVSFESYACTPEAVAELSKLPPRAPSGGITILLSSPKTTAAAPMTPDELESKVLDMIKQGVSPDVVLTYVKGQRLSRRLTAEDIIGWTKAGIPDAVIQAAAAPR